MTDWLTLSCLQFTSLTAPPIHPLHVPEPADKKPTYRMPCRAGCLSGMPACAWSRTVGSLGCSWSLHGGPAHPPPPARRPLPSIPRCSYPAQPVPTPFSATQYCSSPGNTRDHIPHSFHAIPRHSWRSHRARLPPASQPASQSVNRSPAQQRISTIYKYPKSKIWIFLSKLTSN